MTEEDRRDLVTLNRLDELLKPRQGDIIAKITVITRSLQKRRHPPDILQEALVQRIRSERIRQAQEEKLWIVNLKKYLVGDVSNLSSDEAKTCAKISPDYEIGENDLLFFCPIAKRETEDREGLVRLVILEKLQQDFLRHYHARLEGGHQGISRTYQRIRSRFHWRGLYRSVPLYAGRMYGLRDSKRVPDDPRKVARQSTSDLPFPDHSRGPHSVAAEVLQREYRATYLGRSLFRVCYRESLLIPNGADDCGKL